MQALLLQHHTCTPTRCTLPAFKTHLNPIITSSSLSHSFHLQSLKTTTVHMADRDRSQPHNLHMQPHQPPRHEGGTKQLLPRTGPSTSQILAVVTLLPLTLTLLGLAGITLAGTLLGLAVATPIFVICSPVLVPAAILMAGAVTAIISSGAFGVTGLSSLSYVFNSFRKGQGPVDFAMRGVQEGTMQVGEKARQMGEHVGEKTKQTGEMIKSKAQPEGKEGAGGRT